MQGAHSSSGGGAPRGILRRFERRISPSSGESVKKKKIISHSHTLNGSLVCFMVRKTLRNGMRIECDYSYNVTTSTCTVEFSTM